MKIFKPLAFSVFLACVLFLTGFDTAPVGDSSYIPFYMERSDLRTSVTYAAGERKMEDPGKIWVRGSEIFVVERYKGVHVINNSNPSDPVRTGFITAPGCMDVAIKGNMLYLDNAIDLVAFDLDTKEVTSRIEDFFPEPVSPAGEGRGYSTPANLVRVGWKKAASNN